MARTDAFPRVYALTDGQWLRASDEADEIVLLARRRKNVSARKWIKVLAGAGAARARYRQALALAFPPAE